MRTSRYHGQADVPLHVAVEEERFAGEVVGEVVRVAIAAREDAELLRRRIPVEDRAVRAFARALAEVREVRQELRVLVLEDERRQIERVVGDGLVVADDDGHAAVGPAPDRVRSVLLDRSRHAERFEGIGDIVSVGVLELEEAGAVVDVGSAAAASRRRWRRCRDLLGRWHHRACRVERLAFEPQALAIADLVADDFFGFVDAVFVVVEQQSRKVVLFGHDQPPEAVERDDHVAVALVGRVHPLDRKSWQRAELHAGNGLGHEARLIRRLSQR